MIRAGLRLEEQSSLTLYEVPDRDGSRAYYRYWLPASIAKWGSARDVYVPDETLRSVTDYIEIDRAEAVEQARATGRYERIRDALVIEDLTRPRVRCQGRWLSVEDLSARRHGPGRAPSGVLVRHVADSSAGAAADTATGSPPASAKWCGWSYGE
jgi:hypothetical protein